MFPPRRRAPTLQVVQIMWMAMTVSVLIYGGLAFYVAGTLAAARDTSGAGAQDPYSNPIVVVLHLAGFAALAMGFFVPGRIVRASRTNDPLAPPPEPGAPFVLSLAVMRATVVRFAMYEAAAVMGLVLAMVTATPFLFLPLGLLSLSALLMAFPSEDRLRELEESARNVM